VEPHIVKLSPEARGLFREYQEYLYIELNRLGDDAPLRAPLGKMTGQLARIALIVHLVRAIPSGARAGSVVDAESMHRAIRLTEYFLAHARRAWQVLTEAPEERCVRKLLDRIKRSGPAGMTRRDILRSGVAGIRTQAEANTYVGRLADMGCIEWFKIGKTDRIRAVEGESS
jgi:hypothetical protein